jgi:HAD superfamily hydrolase (TIGR01490 family)
MTLAIFDLDNTLLAGDSDHLWGQYLVEHQIVDADLYARENERFYREYREGNLDIYEFLDFSLKPLADHSLEELFSWRYEFVETLIKPIVLPKAVELVEQHLLQEDTLLSITATNRFVTEPIAEVFGIENLLATDPELNAHGYTGRVAGTPCFQEGKVTRLNEWLAKTGVTLDGACFYSDSHNDIPLLKMVDRPCAVDPDDQLKSVASSKGWPVISLRNTVS